LRSELNLPPDEKHNPMNVGFDPKLPNPIQQMIPAAQLQKYPNLANITGGIQFAGVNGNRTRATLSDLNNIQPRFGLAYQVTPKLVFRGGYGLYCTNSQRHGIMTTLRLYSNTTL